MVRQVEAVEFELDSETVAARTNVAVWLTAVVASVACAAGVCSSAVSTLS